jgi:uncharacterized membrane protein YjgN (DUF898 family)
MVAKKKGEESKDAGESLPFSFHGNGGTLFGIHILNLFLSIVTLGIYHFWAKVKVRKYLWSQFEVAGDRLAYHGTPLEILIGWLKAAGFFGIPYLLLSQLPQWMDWGLAAKAACGFGTAVLIWIFIPVAVVGSRRYRLSRTSWRNIRFSFRGRVMELLGIYLGGGILLMLTLTLYGPYFRMRVHRFLSGQTKLGDRKFEFDGDGKDLFGKYALCLVLALPTLFFSLVWYSVYESRYVWAHTHFGEARFRSTLSFGGSLGIAITNFLLVLFTLGFGYSWAMVRYYRFLAENLNLDGEAGLDSIQQEDSEVGAAGDELLGFLDAGFDLG